MVKQMAQVQTTYGNMAHWMHNGIKVWGNDRISVALKNGTVHECRFVSGPTTNHAGIKIKTADGQLHRIDEDDIRSVAKLKEA